MISELICIHPQNFWIITGCLFLLLEVLLNCYLLWSGIAALTVGVLLWINPFNWKYQGLAFVIITIVLVWLSWRYLKFVKYKCPMEIKLNQRDKQLIGLRIKLSEPISNGFGRLRIGDSTWLIKSNEDLPVNTWVEIYATESIMLCIRRIFKKKVQFK